MGLYSNWTDLPEEIRTTAIYRNYLRALIPHSQNRERDLNRYIVLQIMLSAYPVDDLMPEYYHGLQAPELEVILQFCGIDVDQI